MNIFHNGLERIACYARRLALYGCLQCFVFFTLTYKVAGSDPLPLLPPQVAADILANRSGLDLSRVLLSYTYSAIPQPDMDAFDEDQRALTGAEEEPGEDYKTCVKYISTNTYKSLIMSPDQFYFRVTDGGDYEGNKITEYSSDKTYQAVYYEDDGALSLVRDALPGGSAERYSRYLTGFLKELHLPTGDSGEKELFRSIKERMHGDIEVSAGKTSDEQVIRFTEPGASTPAGKLFYQYEVTLKLGDKPRVSEYTVRYALMRDGVTIPRQPIYKIEYGDYATFAPGVDLPKTIRVIACQTIPRRKTSKASDSVGVSKDRELIETQHHEFTLTSARIVSDAEAARLCSPRLDEKPDGTWVIDEISGNKYIKGNPLAKSLKAVEELKKKP